MNLVFIYGPPAVGKLTVATEVSKLTGYKLFHNHLTVDLITSLFPFDSEQFSRLSSKIRLELLEEAQKARLDGVIFTMVYGPEVDNGFVNKVVDITGKETGKAFFVKLTADPETLKERVTLSSRERFNKTTSPQTLDEVLTKYDVFASIPDHQSFEIDTVANSPEKSANLIIDHYNLSRI